MNRVLFSRFGFLQEKIIGAYFSMEDFNVLWEGQGWESVETASVQSSIMHEE